METKDIDLTKYNNLQFKAVIGGSISTGTIRQDRGTFLSLTTMMSRHYVSYENLLCLIEGGNITHHETVISDFEIIPRAPETYKDWQVGDKATCPGEKWNRIVTLEVIFRSGEFVALKDLDGCFFNCYTCQELFQKDYRLVLTDIEKRIIEEKIPKAYEFKARDVVMVRDAKERWKLMTFVAMGSGAYKYEVTNGEKFSAYKHCIPYNEKTMHLLGTGEDYKEES